MKIRKQLGMTLIELMTALAIGAFLMIGAITVFMQSRTTFRVTESLARMQENARFALEVLEPDVRMAHYWGLTTTTQSIANREPPAAGNAWGKNPCAANGALVLDLAVTGDNNSNDFTCAMLAPLETNADTLVVRRVGQDALPAAALAPNVRYLQSVRGTGDSRLFTGTTVPGGYTALTSATHRLVVNAYYVSRSSTGNPNVPSLRVQTLQGLGLVDQEVVSGVEDLQVQFGVDTDAPGSAERGSIDRWVDPEDPLIDWGSAGFDPNAEILAVRVWLRIRAERPEQGHTDTAAYVYADRNVGPFNDAFRRIVVSKTIYLRNARPLS
jgi:prepilin-type N-terminal cleavage/methylation domain-containing protein